MAKKNVVPVEAPKDHRCSFRAVASAEKRKAGTGMLLIEHRQPGGTIWMPSITGLDMEDVEKALRHLEGRGCTIEYTEFFQPNKVKNRR